jgi:prepilin signal peptidase PulO-like enzyme (type II secretory pathway)
VGLFFFASGCLVYRRYRRWRLPGEPNGFFSVSLAGLLSGLSAGLVAAVCLLPDFQESASAYNLSSSLLGMLTGSALVFIIGVVGTLVFRKPAMGFGDVKLMGLLGALTGCWGAVSAFFLACILGSIVGIPRRLISGDRHLAFGPFLMIAGVFVYLWRDAVDLALEWYMGLFSV